MKETKEYIIQKAFVLFLQKSYKEVTMQDIVKSTGLSKGAFYHYFKSKETVFEEVIRYFYDHIMITDYNDFPTTSLKEFYQTYIRKLHTPTSLDDLDSEANLLVFISEAARKVPAFNQIHTAQRKKEIDAWSHAISRAKYSGEISSDIPDQELGKMFIYLSDRISLTTISHKPNEETLRDLRNSWDNLYKLLQATEKK